MIFFAKIGVVQDVLRDGKTSKDGLVATRRLL
jgi:hypothetical protein